jgi:hypothetical protein
MSKTSATLLLLLLCSSNAMATNWCTGLPDSSYSVTTIYGNKVYLYDSPIGALLEYKPIWVQMDPAETRVDVYVNDELSYSLSSPTQKTECNVSSQVYPNPYQKRSVPVMNNWWFIPWSLSIFALIAWFNKKQTSHVQNKI